MQKASSWVTIWPPITLAVLGAIGQGYGRVKLLDGNVENLTMNELLVDIEKFRPDLVVINTGFPSIDGDMRVAKNIKDSLSNAKMLSFGVYFTLLEGQGMTNYPFLDYAIIGEPEETFQELLELLSEGSESFDDIKGLCYRNSEGIKVNEKRPLIKDLDKIPYPARDLLKNDAYRLPHNNKTYIQQGAALFIAYTVL
jgi:anaerobic magnesium-protoporphyrin IX monomethyl ester cyclase